MTTGTSGPLVSLIVAAYNVDQYLDNCIKSILNQTYGKIEVIVVDDGSTDESGDIADFFADNDKRVSVIHQKNSGLSKCRNTGLARAKGEFVAFVDGDDWLASDFVEYMLTIIWKCGSDVAMSRECFTSNDYSQVADDVITCESPDDTICDIFFLRMKLGVWNKLYRLDFLRRNKFDFVETLSTGEGLEFLSRVIPASSSIGVGKRRVYYYRVNNPNSATTKPDVEKQGIGSLHTMQYIIQNSIHVSPAVKEAYHWHYWACYRYCLRQIIDSNAINQYSELTHECATVIRKNALATLPMPVSLHFKIGAILSFISPIGATKFSLFRQKRRLR